MAVILSAHARRVATVRGIAVAWIETAVHAPGRVTPDPTDSALTRSFCRIPDYGGRVLRVVHRPYGPDILIVTAFFDRGASL